MISSIALKMILDVILIFYLTHAPPRDLIRVNLERTFDEFELLSLMIAVLYDCKSERVMICIRTINIIQTSQLVIGCKCHVRERKR